MKKSLVPKDIIESKIFYLRGKKVMLDKDPANLYGVQTGQLKRAASRNKERFPSDFMFKLNKKEFEILRCHFGISS